MLTTARPIFEHVPASFADPLGLADQQAQGIVSLIIARYPAPRPAEAHRANATDHVPPHPSSLLGPTFDAFVASSGQLLTVARTTPDYRFPVTPAAALARFIDHRDAGHDVALSLYELEESECARFLETVFYAECLKLHVDGPASAPLIARQIARSRCRGGVLEVNDFSDPRRPRVQLLDLEDVASSTEGADADELVPLLSRYLDGVVGRVLLYDRAKNRATLPDRAGRAFDLDGILDQANRLANAQRRPSADPTPHIADGTPSPDDQADTVEDYLRERAKRPRLVDPTHPHATGLGALIAELQGGPPMVLSPETNPLDDPPQASASHDGEALTAEPTPLTSSYTPPSPAQSSPRSDSPPLGEMPHRGRGGSLATLPSTSIRHPLATELDRLRTDVFERFEDAVGRDRAVAHEAHILDETGIASPVAPADTVAYLRALLCDEPPKRWHFFKRSRSKIYEEVAGTLLAFHAVGGHLDDPVVHEVTKLWTRLHK